MRRTVAERMAMKAVAQLTDMATTVLKVLLDKIDWGIDRREEELGQERTISGTSAAGVHVTGIDTAGITDGVDGREGSGTLGCRTGQSVGDPGQSHDETGVHTGNHEHHGEVTGAHASRTGCDNEGGHRDIERKSDVPITFSRAVRMPGIKEGSDDRQDVGRSREKKTLDFAVVEGLDDSGKEVGNGSRGDHAENHNHLDIRCKQQFEIDRRALSSYTHQDIRLDIQSGQLGSMKERLLFGVNPIVLTDILLETPSGELLFLLSEPARSTREVGEDEHRQEGNDDSDSTFNDEEPSPSDRLARDQ